MSDNFANQIRQNVQDFWSKMRQDRGKEKGNYQESLKELTNEDLIIHYEAYPSNVPLKLEMQRRGLLKNYGIR